MGCSDDDGERSQPASPPPQPSPSAAPEPGRGLDRSNEEEVVELLSGTVSARPVRCRTTRLEPGSPSLYRCRAAAREYEVEWRHYGTGAYTIRALPGRRVIARGTLSISQ